MADWFLELDPEHQAPVAAAIDLLEQHGPTLGRPVVDRVQGSARHNMKELRPLGTSYRILFVFDPRQQAVWLVAGDKAGMWNAWYPPAIREAERRYKEYLDSQREEADRE